MRIAIGCDHAGFWLKELIKQRLIELGHSCEDFGSYSTQSVDYTDFSLRVARAVSCGDCERGIVICGTGIGSAITANKVAGIRCAVCWNEYTARLSRLHNDANVLALGGRVLGSELALSIVETWLNTPFSGEERHVRRLTKISGIEQGH